MYSLLGNILLHNGKYFFKPSVVRSLGNPTKPPEEILHQPEFLGILQAFGQSFLQPDVTLFQQNIKALIEVNSRWKLFHKVSQKNNIPMASNYFIVFVFPCRKSSSTI